MILKEKHKLYAMLLCVITVSITDKTWVIGMFCLSVRASTPRAHHADIVSREEGSMGITAYIVQLVSHCL